MTWLVERLADLRRHLVHLRELAGRVPDADSLRRDLSLHNDVLFSLLMVCQLVIDIAGELSSRRKMKFADYTQAIRNLGEWSVFPAELVTELARLPGFRNVLLHEYAELDLDRAIEALRRLDAVERFLKIVASLEQP